MIDPQSIATPDYAPVVQEQIEIINEVLDEVGMTKLFENPNVVIKASYDSYLEFNISRNGSNSVELDFDLANDGMSIGFQGFPESFEFSKAYIQNSRSKVKQFVASLLTCPILVEYKGGTQYVNMFNPDGSRFGISALQSFFTLITGGYWKSQNMDQHLFEPLFPAKS